MDVLYVPELTVTVAAVTVAPTESWTVPFTVTVWAVEIEWAIDKRRGKESVRVRRDMEFGPRYLSRGFSRPVRASVGGDIS